ncbi:hypothetical protein [Variovorax sp. 770b2]|uniref:hypothetical protein n=1 Tax=Variovorax sp. 770b2 TaxID=1566271 RepID=UPI0008EE7983|nr:hypothetical protein [Variovorax sp. 770b2]SFP15327.1 hypothetical protein SAMN03159339_0599 [Variovorax sp. 770b2]
MLRATDVLHAAIDARDDEAEQVQSKRVAGMSQTDMQKWMIAEANRLVEARRQIERPARAVWTNQIHNPDERAPDLERAAINDTAAQVAARLAKRDSADEDARW